MDRPTVLFVGCAPIRFNGDEEDKSLVALIYFLRTHLGCDFVSVLDDQDVQDELVRFKALGDRLLCILIQEDPSDATGWVPGHLEVVTLAQREFASVPLAIIPYPRFSLIKDGDVPGVPVMDDNSEALITLIRDRLHGIVVPVDYFGAVTDWERDELLTNLERSHWVTSAGEELAIPDRNGRICAQLLRLRLTPPSLVKNEFDDALQNEEGLAPISPTVYITELRRLKRMNDAERWVFLESLRVMQGYFEVEHVLVFAGHSLGGFIKGFAFDPETGERVLASGHGSHKLARLRLISRLEYIDELRLGRGIGDRDEIEKRIVWGLVYTRVDNFSSPILECVGSRDDRQIQAAARVLIREGEFLPVDYEGRLIDDGQNI